MLLVLSLSGLSALRLVKVEIPTYKFRGESALLECVYELNGGGGGNGQVVMGPRSRGQLYTARYRAPLDYVDGDDGDTEDHRGVIEEEFNYAKRKRKKYARYEKFDPDHGNVEQVDEAGFEDDPGQPMDENSVEDEQERDEIHNNNNEEFDEEVPHFHPSSSSSSATYASNGGGSGFPETLYSVKWYKDNEEFYRYVPKAKTPQTSYKVEGVRVDVSTNVSDQRRRRRSSS